MFCVRGVLPSRMVQLWQPDRRLCAASAVICPRTFAQRTNSGGTTERMAVSCTTSGGGTGSSRLSRWRYIQRIAPPCRSPSVPPAEGRTWRKRDSPTSTYVRSFTIPVSAIRPNAVVVSGDIGVAQRGSAMVAHGSYSAHAGVVGARPCARTWFWRLQKVVAVAVVFEQRTAIRGGRS